MGLIPIFQTVSRRWVLGSSLSSGAARRRLQIFFFQAEDGIRDAPLEAPQRFFARFALRYLLAVVGSAPNVRPTLAEPGDHVQSIIELAVSDQREPVAYHLATRGLHRRRSTGVGGKVGLGREAHHIADRSDDLRGQYWTFTPKISVRVVAEASTSASMRPSRSAIFRCSVRMSRKISEASCRRRRAEAPWDRMPRRMCMRLGGSRAFQLPHRGRGLVEARAGG